MKTHQENKRKFLSYLKSLMVKDTIIYRLENIDGNGPYEAIEEQGLWADDGLHENFNGHPMISDGFLEAMSKEHYTDYCVYTILEKLQSFCGTVKNKSMSFAFASLEDLTLWFTERELMILKNMGQNIVAYRVKRAFNFPGQCVYCKDEVIEKVSLPLNLVAS